MFPWFTGKSKLSFYIVTQGLDMKMAFLSDDLTSWYGREKQSI